MQDPLWPRPQAQVSQQSVSSQRQSSNLFTAAAASIGLVRLTCRPFPVWCGASLDLLILGMQLWLLLQWLMHSYCMQRLTGVCLRLASIVAEQLMKDGAWLQQAAVRLRQWPAHSGNWPWKRKQHQPHEQQQQQQQHSQAAEEVKQQKQRLLAAQLMQAQSMLQQHRPDKELMRVIKTLGDSNIPLDTKWLEFTQRLASHGHDAIR